MRSAAILNPSFSPVMFICHLSLTQNGITWTPSSKAEMSGLEAAAFVVGAIPLLVEFLKTAGSGIENARLLFSASRFQRQLSNWCAVLMTQRASMLNNITLVIRTIDIYDIEFSDVEEMLVRGELPPIFKSKTIGAQLDASLGRNREPFQRTIAVIESSFKEIEERMGIKNLLQVSLH